MRNLIGIFVSLAALMPLPAAADSSVPPAIAAIKPFASSGEMAALISNAKRIRKDGQALVVQQVKGVAPYLALLEYRVAGTPPLVHENDWELFYVVEGSGTMELGGTLINGKRVNIQITETGALRVDNSDPQKTASSPNLLGTGAEGSTSFKVSKGEFVIVPPHTVHGLSAVNGELAMLSIHAVLQPMNSVPSK